MSNRSSKVEDRSRISGARMPRAVARFPGIIPILVSNGGRSPTLSKVGWYKNATLYRNWQKPPAGSKRTDAGDDFGYYVSASSADATLLPKDDRLVVVPHGKGGIGQSNVWYADSADTHPAFHELVEAYLASRRPPPVIPGGTTKQPDPFLRQKVERAAVAETVAYLRQTWLSRRFRREGQQGVGFGRRASDGKSRS
jgi:hypothetical protein